MLAAGVRIDGRTSAIVQHRVNDDGLQSIDVQEFVGVQQHVAEVDQAVVARRSCRLAGTRSAVADSSAVGGAAEGEAIGGGDSLARSWRRLLASSRSANALARCSIQGPLIISSDCVGVVVTLRSGVVMEPSGASKASSSGSRVLRMTFV